MSATRQTITCTDTDGRTLGWAVPHPYQDDQFFAIYACTQEEWSTDTEPYDAAPNVGVAEELVSRGVALDGGFLYGAADRVEEILSDS